MTMLIDPFTQTIARVELDATTEEEFLDSVRREVGAPQLTVIAVGGGNYAVWLDNMGYLKQRQSFWRFSHDTHRFAGKAVLTALNPEGYPMELPPGTTAEEVAKGITWCPDDKIVRVAESIVIIPWEGDGRPVPVIGREAVFEVPEVVIAESEPADAEIGWTVYETDDGRYRALKLRLTEDGSMTSEGLLTANSLDDLRAQLPPGLRRIEPGAADDPSIVESWMTA